MRQSFIQSKSQFKISKAEGYSRSTLITIVAINGEQNYEMHENINRRVKM